MCEKANRVGFDSNRMCFHLKLSDKTVSLSSYEGRALIKDVVLFTSSGRDLNFVRTQAIGAKPNRNGTSLFVDGLPPLWRPIGGQVFRSVKDGDNPDSGWGSRKVWNAGEQRCNSNDPKLDSTPQ
jgi:hypothetical protein